MLYIENNSTDANFNFALEKYAMQELDAADEYFIFWRTTPTLMIGSYQNPHQEINMDYAEKNNVNIVRRITGGGTIYTDMNGWQFSFISKGKNKDKEIDFEKYTKIIVRGLASIGVKAVHSGRNDLLVDGRKISGNAQYHDNSVSLHHGSLLFNTDLEALVRALNVDDEKIISKGIKSVKQRVTNIADHVKKEMTSEEFKDAMLEHLLEDMGRYTLTEEDIQRVNAIKKEQFDTWEWNMGRTPKFNITKENRFAGGKVQVCVYVEKGIIDNVEFYGDFFAQKDLNDLENALKGIEYNSAAVAEKLIEINAGEYFFKVTVDDLISLFS